MKKRRSPENALHFTWCRSHERWIRVTRISAAAVWFLFGIVLKVLGVEPRHRLIVARILGKDFAPRATIVIGFLEGALGIWVLTGIRPRACAAVQTVAIVSMNIFEIIYVRHLLLAPALMVCANTLFLSLIWYSALKSPEKKAISMLRGIHGR
jgi:hypothetical protein